MNTPNPVPSQPPAIPATQSPVAVGLVVVLVSQVVQFLRVFNVQLPFTDEQISQGGAMFALCAGSAAALWALWKRARSPVQPLTLTQAGADAKSDAIMANKQSGRATLPALVMLVLAAGGCAVLTLSVSGCAALGIAQPTNTAERIASALTQNTGLRNTSVYALEHGAISAKEGGAVMAVNDQARALLDLAASAANEDAAKRNLDLALALMRELQRRLEVKGTP
jgi:hypothetical protein